MIKVPNRPQQDKDNQLPGITVANRYVSKYDPGLSLTILERLAEGETLNAICRGQPGMPHPTTFRRWMVNNPELARAFEVAMRISASSLEEEALDTARSIARAPKDGTHVRAAEVKLGQLRWSAERRDPTKFGQKSQVSIKVPVQIITPIDLNMPAGQNNIQDIYTIEAKALKSPAQAAQEAQGTEQLVPEKPIRHASGPRKRVLTPRIANPFGKIQDEKDQLRPEGSGHGDREEQRGPGDQELHIPGRQANPPAEQEAGPRENPQDDGEGK